MKPAEPNSVDEQLCEYSVLGALRTAEDRSVTADKSLSSTVEGLVAAASQLDIQDRLDLVTIIMDRIPYGAAKRWTVENVTRIGWQQCATTVTAHEGPTVPKSYGRVGES